MFVNHKMIVEEPKQCNIQRKDHIMLKLYISYWQFAIWIYPSLQILHDVEWCSNYARVSAQAKDSRYRNISMNTQSLQNLLHNKT